MVPSEPIHLRPTAELAERVLLPGDPGRALLLAQTLIAEPRMFNHHRGLWGYTGAARADGAPVTIQSTGMGGPSAAIVLSELICLGARRAVRVGTCQALRPELALGDLVIAREAICRDGTSRALGTKGRVAADAKLTQALIRSASGARAGAVVSVDVLDETAGSAEIEDALVLEMEAAALFALGSGARIPVACVLAVGASIAQDGVRARIDDRSLRAAAETMGAAALNALAP